MAIFWRVNCEQTNNENHVKLKVRLTLVESKQTFPVLSDAHVVVDKERDVFPPGRRHVDGHLVLQAVRELGRDARLVGGTSHVFPDCETYADRATVGHGICR